MFRKVLTLLLLAALVWAGARYFAHRGEVRATLVFRDAAPLRKGDAVVEDGETVGRVTKVTRLDGQDAVAVRLDKQHRRAIVGDSLFTVDGHRVVVTNTFAVGKPIDDGAVLRAKDDRLSRWLAKHSDGVQPLMEKLKRAADKQFDALDAELASATLQMPQWKREGKQSFDQHLAALKKKIEKAEDDLQRSDKAAEAKKLRERFERWLDEVGR